MANVLMKVAGRVARWLPASMRKNIYRLGPVSRWIRQALNRAAPAGLTEVQVASGAIAGLTFRLDLHKEKDCWLGNYETDLQEAAARFVRSGMTVYDVGANIGYVTLVFATLAGSKGNIFAFEALPSNVERLVHHIAINGFAETVEVIHTAVVDQPGPVEFMVHSSHGMGKASGSGGRKEDYRDRIKVAGTSLDVFVFEEDNPPPQLVKMDIEGGEVMAVPGMRRTLAVHRPIVFLELHGKEAAETAWEVFTAADYTIHRMARDFPNIKDVSKLDWKAYIIAVPRNKHQ